MDDSTGGLMDFNGTTWSTVTTSPTPPSPYNSTAIPEEISCPSVNWCLVLFTVANGTTSYSATYNPTVGIWTQGILVPVVNMDAPDFNFFLKCAAVNFCMGTNNYGYYEIFSNGSWGTVGSIPDTTTNPYTSGQLQCMNSSTGPVCYVRVDPYINNATIPGLMEYSNGSWSSTEIDFPVVQNEPPYNDQGSFLDSQSVDNPYNYSCPTANFCMVQYFIASNYQGFYSSYNISFIYTNGSWKYSGVMFNNNDWQYDTALLSCATPDYCFAVNEDYGNIASVYRTNGNNVGQWTQNNNYPFLNNAYLDLSCTSVDFCAVTGGGKAFTSGISPNMTPYTGSITRGGNAVSLNCQCQTGASPQPSSPNDPVNIATGDYYTSDTDLNVSTTGIPLSLTRSVGQYSFEKS